MARLDKTTKRNIDRQRLALVVLFILGGAAAWWQNAGEMPTASVKTFSATELPPAVADLDFTSAAASWSDLHVDAQGALKIDGRLELALSETIALTRDEAFEAQAARIALLIEKQLGASASRQFAELLPVLQNYKEAEQRWWQENGRHSPPPYADLFALQDDMLGEALAAQLFADQRRMANVMLASYQIQHDESLTQAQKDRALMDLQSGFGEAGLDD